MKSYTRCNLILYIYIYILYGLGLNLWGPLHDDCSFNIRRRHRLALVQAGFKRPIFNDKRLYQLSYMETITHTLLQPCT